MKQHQQQSTVSTFLSSPQTLTSRASNSSSNTTQHNTKQNNSNQQHNQLVVQPLACIGVIFLLHIVMVLVVQDQYYI
jgi:hypothetical protein